MEPEVSFSCSQDYARGNYCFQTQCNIILAFTLSFSDDMFSSNCLIRNVVGIFIFHIPLMWFDNKVCELIAAKVLHTSLLNITVVVFKVLPLGSCARMPAHSPPL
jgi:hypothetical protein